MTGFFGLRWFPGSPTPQGAPYGSTDMVDRGKETTAILCAALDLGRSNPFFSLLDYFFLNLSRSGRYRRYTDGRSLPP
jgi:hypothetical protein